MTESIELSRTSQPVEGFSELSDLAYKTAGLVLSPRKAPLIVSRLRHRLSTLGISKLSEYCRLVKSDETGAETSLMLSALTTNVSGFFREPHHFEQLKAEILPGMLSKLNAGKKVRIWSAGCSKGQEPFSIAMQCLEFSDKFSSMDFKILATDIDREVLSFANSGVYEENHISGVEDKLINKYFQTESILRNQSTFLASEQLRSIISFKHLNLIDDWPMRGKFDAIFCRNVVIYFDSPTQQKLWNKFTRVLDPGGVIFVGHSERIDNPQFTSCGATAYKLT